MLLNYRRVHRHAKLFLEQSISSLEATGKGTLHPYLELLDAERRLVVKLHSLRDETPPESRVAQTGEDDRSKSMFFDVSAFIDA